MPNEKECRVCRRKIGLGESYFKTLSQITCEDCAGLDCCSESVRRYKEETLKEADLLLKYKWTDTEGVFVRLDEVLSLIKGK